MKEFWLGWMLGPVEGGKRRSGRFNNHPLDRQGLTDRRFRGEWEFPPRFPESNPRPPGSLAFYRARAAPAAASTRNANRRFIVATYKVPLAATAVALIGPSN